ncbi:pre-peptidase C-terminal domain-containing protein [Kovacikia minuta CCNUW1]|uniref:CARDB domain-containing protein n=1 Tax=Kovacikia minuta TaxID=2931930 RepID=UPI001CCD9A72|nr:CARDB domain-containing protein [Kovacikia minuta]UBF23766.1 pre-peptidase C-terminal domain-containing protein [Kovacikia minuta CCNUW1]
MPADYAGNTLGTARVINATSNSQVFVDRVDSLDSSDYYHFSLGRRSSLNLTVKDLSADANLQLLNSSGAVIQSSTNSAGIAESINTILNPGTYYLRVYQGKTDASTSYSLNLTSQTDHQVNILWRDYANGSIASWSMSGTSNTSVMSASLLTSMSASWQMEGVADFNNDNHPDLLWRHRTSGNNVIWFMGGADNTSVVSSASLAQVATNWHIEGVADFNGDDRPDLLWRDYTNGKNAIWFMGGTHNTSVVSSTFLTQLATNWHAEGVADFNGDDRPDLLWRDYATGNNVVWFMGGTSSTSVVSSASLSRVATNWRIEGVADFNNDDRPDLLWRDYTNGKNALWFMGGTNNTSVISASSLAALPTQWQAVPYVQGVNSIDGAGNTLATAFKIGGLNGTGQFRDRLDPSDLNDYYSFSLSNLSDFKLDLNGLSGDADVQLLKQDGTPIVGSHANGAAAESINRQLAAGTYYIRVYPVSGVSTNYALNVSATPVTVDLRGTWFDVTEPLTAGDSITAKFQVQNLGAGNAGAFRVGFYVSADSTITTDDRLLGFSDISALAANTTTGLLTASLLLPNSIDAFWSGSRTYYIGMVVDSLNAISEISESNNANLGNGIDFDDVAITVPAPDLRGAFFDTQTASKAGSAAAINFQIRNAGIGNAGTFRVGFYLSKDTTITTADRLLGFRDIGFLGAGGTTAMLTQNLLLPGSTDSFWSGSQTYYIGMVVDSLNAFRESNETNNSNLSRGIDWDDSAISVNLTITNPTIASFTTTGNTAIDALLAPSPYNYYWNTSANGGIITYSFLSSAGASSYYGSEIVSEVSTAIKNNVRAVLASLESFINIRFVEVADTATKYGVLRYMFSDEPSYAYAYYPSADPLGGDVHLTTAYETDSVNKFSGTSGNHGYMTLIHETLHALGVKHPGNYNGSGTGSGPFLSPGLDNTTNTLMSYNFDGAAAITPMAYDIRALQYLYGAKNKNGTATTYSFTSVSNYVVNGEAFGNATTQIKQSIWDNGGIDTLDFSGLSVSGSYRFDLNQGGILTTQGAYNGLTYNDRSGGGAFVTSSFGTTIAYNSTIENLINSRGNDYIIANSANNVFKGYAVGTFTGNDVIEASSLSDTLELTGYSLANLTATISGSDLTLKLGSNGSIQIKNYYGSGGSIKTLIGTTYYTYSATGGWQVTNAPTAPALVNVEPAFSVGLTAITPTQSEVASGLTPVVACHCPICTGKQTGLNLLGEASLSV